MTPRKLAAARKKLGLTPTEMARAMGVPYDTYKDWQSGRHSMPSVAVRCVELQGKYLNMWTERIEHVNDIDDISTEELVRLIRELAESGDVDLHQLIAEPGAEDFSSPLCPGSKKTH